MPKVHRSPTAPSEPESELLNPAVRNVYPATKSMPPTKVKTKRSIVTGFHATKRYGRTARQSKPDTRFRFAVFSIASFVTVKDDLGNDLEEDPWLVCCLAHCVDIVLELRKNHNFCLT